MPDEKPKEFSTPKAEAAGIHLHAEDTGEGSHVAMNYAKEETDPKELHLLSDHPHHRVVEAVAANEHTDPKTLAKIHKQYKNHPEHHYLANDAARNHNAPAEIVNKEIEDYDPKAFHGHSSVLFHPKADTKLVQKKVGHLLSDKSRLDDDDKKNLTEKFVESKHAGPKHIDFLTKHKTPEVAIAALKSPHATLEHHQKVIANPDLEPKHLKNIVEQDAERSGVTDNFEDIKPKLDAPTLDKIREIHKEKMDKKPKDEGGHSHWDHRRLDQELLKHPNLAPETVKNIYHGDKKEGEEDAGLSEAISHPNMPMDEVQKAVDKSTQGEHINSFALGEILNRPDLPSSMINQIDQHVEKNRKDMRKYEKENLIPKLVNHPNYPREKHLKKIQQDPFAARDILGERGSSRWRNYQHKPLDKEQLSALIQHKNKDIAIQALRHPNITKEHVQEAFERKAGDVSRAAATHELATPEMKSSKVEGDPAALPGMARDEEDPSVLHRVFEKGKEDPKVIEHLQKNPNTPPELLSKVIDQVEKRKAENVGENYHHTKSMNLEYGLGQHPSFKEEHAIKLGKIDHPSVTPEGVRQILNNTDDEDKPRKAADALDNPNIDPGLAKEILTGQHGKINKHNSYGDSLKVNERPETFTKDVVNSVLNNRHEMVPDWAVHELSQSKHLGPEEIENHLKNSFKQGNSKENEDHRKALVTGLMKNPNTSSDTLHKVLTDPKFSQNFINSQEHAKAAEEAASNPNLSTPHLQDFYRNHFGQSQNVGLFPSEHGPIQSEIIDQIRNRRLTGDALKTGNHFVTQSLISKGGRSSNGVDVDNALMAMENPDKDVQRSTAEMLHSVRKAIDEPTREKYFDKYADGSYPELMRDAAFPLMSEKKRIELAQGKDPKEMTKLIPGLSNDTVAKMQIKPGDPEEYANEILKHPGATSDHWTQAVEHSEPMAEEILNSNRHSMPMYDKALEKYPNNQSILYHTAKGSLWAKHADDLLKNPRALGDLATVRAMVNNSDFNLPAREDIKTLKGEEYHPLFTALANHEDTKVDTLNHIIKEVPDLAESVASNPKAKSPRLIKQLLLRNDFWINTALAKNEKVPDEIRSEIMKDPKVGLAVDRDKIPAAALHNYAETQDDPYLLNHIVTARQATRQTRDLVAEKLLSKNFTDEKDRNHQYAALRHLAENANSVSPETREKLALHQKNLASNVIDSLSGTEPDDTGHDSPRLKPELYNKIFDKFPDSYEVHTSLLENDALDRDPEFMKKLLDKVDPKELSDSYSDPMSRGLQERMKNLDQKGLLDDDIINKAYEKFHDVKPNQNGLIDGFIAREAGPELQKKILESTAPSVARGINHNQRLDKESVAKIADFYLKNKFSIRGTGGGNEEANQAGHFALNPAVDKATREKVVAHIANSEPDDYWDDREAKSLLANPALSKDTIENLIGKGKAIEDGKSHLLQGLLQNPNTDKAHLIDGLQHYNSAVAVAKNPKFRLSMLNEAFPPGKEDNQSGYIKNEVYKSLVKNYQAHPDDLAHIAKEGILRGDLLQNPKLPKESAQEMVDEMLKKEGSSIYDSGNAENILFSPTIGGEMFRKSIKKEGTDETKDDIFGYSKFPPSLKMDDKAAINDAYHYPSINKVKDVISKIPNDGHLDWAEFKKANPSLAGDPVIQKLFTSAPKQRLTKEHANQYMKDYPDKKSFGVTFRKWTGMQRHNGKPQLVVQLNSSPEYEKTLQDPTVNAVHQIVRRGQYSASHPVTPATIGWSRVDTSDPNHWFIEEVQSDYASGLAKQIHTFLKYGGKRDFEQYNAEPGEIKSAVQKLEQNSSGWNNALMNNIIEMAKKHGVKKISIHSGKSKTKMNKGDSEQITHKYNRLYNTVPEEYGFQPDKYKNLPSANIQDNNGEDPIWTLPLEEDKPVKKSETHANLSKSVSMARDILSRLRNGDKTKT